MVSLMGRFDDGIGIVQRLIVSIGAVIQLSRTTGHDDPARSAGYAGSGRLCEDEVVLP